MNWLPRNLSGEFFSAADGRFDLMFNGLDIYWVAIDSDLGNVFRGSHADCMEWCKNRAGAL